MSKTQFAAALKARLAEREPHRRLITLDQLREKMGGAGRTTIYRWEQNGTIPRAIRIAGHLHWDEAEVDACLDAALDADLGARS